MVAARRDLPGDSNVERSPAIPRSIVELGLRGPTLGVLQRQGILSVEQLVHLTPDQLMGMRRVGLSRMLEIRQALQACGLDLLVDTELPIIRSWGHSHRVRLSCCEYGECVLDLRTAGAGPDEIARVTAAFVQVHRACPRLAGREPVVNSLDTTRPISLVSQPAAIEERTNRTDAERLRSA
jgi:hypothetical protein